MQCKEWSDMMEYIKKGPKLSKSLNARVSKSQLVTEEKHLFKKPKSDEEQLVYEQFCM